MDAPPNVVVFLVDQMRWDASGLHGNPLALTPHFDRLARQHTHLATAVTCQPVCGPARGCFQTGQYATTCGVVENGMPIPCDRPTLASCFNEAGYRTGFVGKWHLWDGEDGPVPPEGRGGYQDWLASNVPEFTSLPYRTTLYDGDGAAVTLPGYRSDAMVDAGIRFIDRHARERPDQPFFLNLALIEPHHQNSTYDYTPPDGYREPYTGRWTPPDLAGLPGTTAQHLGGYWGAVKRVDEGFGRLNDALKSLGLADNTLVLFASDHGCHFETRQGQDKRTWHESSIRIPAAFIGPGFGGGGHRAEPVNLPDLSATLLDAAGLPVPDTFQGRSILPLLRGDAPDWPDDAFIQPISHALVGRAVRTRRWKYAVQAAEGQPRGPQPAEYREAALYDLEHDPYELTNLIGMRSHARVAAAMQERLRRRMAAIGEPSPVIQPAPERGGAQRVVEEADIPKPEGNVPT